MDAGCRKHHSYLRELLTCVLKAVWGTQTAILSTCSSTGRAPDAQISYMCPCSSVRQERLVVSQEVAGSNPVRGAK